MTYAELSTRMSNAEFELWMAEYELRSDECPGCGHTVKEIGQFSAFEVKCPICKVTYHKIRGNKWAGEEV